MMKRSMIQFLGVTIAVVAVLATEAAAQKRIRFNSSGKATIGENVDAERSLKYSVAGKDFQRLGLRQKSGEKFKCEFRRGGQMLWKGNCSGSNSSLKSDGKSTYYLTVINDYARKRPLILEVTSGGPWEGP